MVTCSYGTWGRGLGFRPGVFDDDIRSVCAMNISPLTAAGALVSQYISTPVVV